MPWYQLPHAYMIMWFNQEMDLEPAPFATGGVVTVGAMPGHPATAIDEVLIPDEPDPKEEPEAT